MTSKKIDRNAQKDALKAISSYISSTRPKGEKTAAKQAAKASRLEQRKVAVLAVLTSGTKTNKAGKARKLNMGHTLQQVGVALGLGCTAAEIHETKVNERFKWTEVGKALVSYAKATGIEATTLCTSLSVPLPKVEDEPAEYDETTAPTNRTNRKAAPEPKPKGRRASKGNGTRATA